MLSSIRFKLLLFLVFIVILTGQPVFSLQIDIPRGVFYYQPAASVFGSEAAWINPAGLGRYRNTSYQVMADYFDGNYLKSWGTVMNKEGIGIAYRKLNNPIGEDYREYIFASSVPVGGRVYLGGSYRYFKEGPGIYNKRHFWNIGLLGKEGNKISWGAVFSNLNRSKIDGVSSNIEQRYSLSYRPYGIKYSFSIDVITKKILIQSVPKRI
ncbi:MAG: hypothetical protein ACE5D6_04430 [Candidatus Zixiibacteriota bacterium]